MTMQEIYVTDEFSVHANDSVAIITMPDRNLTSLAFAMERLTEKFGNKTIFFMQSIEKDNEPFKILIVFGLNYD